MKGNLTEPVTLCLINYNGLAYLQEAIAALQTLRIGFDEILVVDNASTDGSLAYLDTLHQVSVVTLSSNNGPAIMVPQLPETQASCEREIILSCFRIMTSV